MGRWYHILDIAAAGLDVVSPARMLAVPLQALSGQAGLVPTQTLLPLGQAALLIGLAIVAGRMRGAMR